MLMRCVLVLLLGLPGLAAAADSTARVAIVNGVPMVVRVLAVRGNPQQIAARMLRQWRDDPAADWVHLEALPQRAIVAQRRGALQVTASLSAAQQPGATRVVVSVLDLRQSQPTRQWGVPVQPANASWLSVVESASGIEESLGFVPVGLPQAQQRWVAALRRAGFTVAVLSDRRIEAQRQGEALGVFLQPAGDGTAVVLQRSAGLP